MAPCARRTRSPIPKTRAQMYQCFPLSRRPPPPPLDEISRTSYYLRLATQPPSPHRCRFFRPYLGSSSTSLLVDNPHPTPFVTRSSNGATGRHEWIHRLPTSRICASCITFRPETSFALVPATPWRCCRLCHTRSMSSDWLRGGARECPADALPARNWADRGVARRAPCRVSKRCSL